MKIVNLDSHGLIPGDLSWEPISSLGTFTAYPYVAQTEEEVLSRIGDAEIVIGNKTSITLENILSFLRGEPQNVVNG